MADYSECEEIDWSNGPIDPALFYEAIFHSELAVYVLAVDADGTATFADANDKVVQIAGRPLSEIRGKQPTACLPGEVGECLEANARQCVQTLETLTYQRSLDLPTGRTSFRTRLMPVGCHGGRITHIVGLTRDVTNEANLLEDARQNATLLQRLGIALPSAIYVLNVQTRSLRFIGGDIDKQRQQWRHTAEAAGSRAASRFHPEDHAKAEEHLRELAALRDGEISTIEYRILSASGEYRRHSHRETVFSRSADGAVELVLGVSDDISERERAEQAVRDLSKRMLTLQFDERRKIAEELHDSTGQHLAAIGMALKRAENAKSGPAGAAALAEAVNDARFSLHAVQRETRVLSYLLHPPEIESQGLGKAITDFATGFGRRAGLQVDLEIAPEADFLDDEISLNLFRVCQEALTNIYRHSEASKARIAVEADAASLMLTVTDNGLGFDTCPLSQTSAPGVGLAGMRERMRRLGGEMIISGGPSGTTLVANVPMTRGNC